MRSVDWVFSSQSVPVKWRWFHLKSLYWPLRPGNVNFDHTFTRLASSICWLRSSGESLTATTFSVASPPMRWFSTMSANTWMPALWNAEMALRYSSFVPYFVRTVPFWSNSPRSYMSYTP